MPKSIVRILFNTKHEEEREKEIGTKAERRKRVTEID